ncbi:unnamed protein product [Blepharisma stoltei]|uniref:Uncharacterized protein n=1 Tax=Blepharisma stoltei TaxID=1481888 RepID=A0AAU9JYC7_9CILI|nr:unnamed protein product [Blepharisma stoltei]
MRQHKFCIKNLSGIKIDFWEVLTRAKATLYVCLVLLEVLLLGITGQSMKGAMIKVKNYRKSILKFLYQENNDEMLYMEWAN